jgi:hypothetical protein
MIFSLWKLIMWRQRRSSTCAGLMQADKRNMQRMAEAVPDSDDQVLQNFPTYSAWDYRPVMDQVAKNADH